MIYLAKRTHSVVAIAVDAIVELSLNSVQNFVSYAVFAAAVSPISYHSQYPPIV